MAKKGVFSKGVVIGIIVLFIGIAVQPSIATIPIDDEVDVDAKEYLFQTIIDIANNPDVKDFIKQNKHNMFTSDFDFKDLNSKLLAKNPRLLTRLLVTRPTLTHGYLDKIYDIGVEMIDILGEEQVYELRDTIIVSDTEFFDELKSIILNDEELSNRIDTLIEINSELFRPLCVISAIIFGGSLFIVLYLYELSRDYENYPIIIEILKAIATPFYCISVIFGYLYIILRCPTPTHMHN